MAKENDYKDITISFRDNMRTYICWIFSSYTEPNRFLRQGEEMYTVLQMFVYQEIGFLKEDQMANDFRVINNVAIWKQQKGIICYHE